MLEAFWRHNIHPSSRIHEAAHEYGPYAVICLAAIALELLVVVVVSIDRAAVIGALAIAFEALDLVSLWWAIVRYRALRRESVTPA